MNSGKTVSLCIIAKDEESCIASCINSVKHLVSEIILVDTGSRDRTGDLARQIGARVFDFPWPGDFAAARNFSLDQATGKWILVLDADEVMEAVKPDEFKALLEAPGVEGYFVNIQSYLGDGQCTTRDQVVRLFKNRPEYRFEGAIHEQVALPIKRYNKGGGLAFSNLLIHHFGYTDRQLQHKNKRDRNITVIKKALAVNPVDPFLHYSLGIEYYQSGQTARGNEQMKNALSLMGGNEGYFRDALVSLGLGLLQAGEYGRLSTMLDKALEDLPCDPDLRLVRGLMDMQSGRYRTASEDLATALSGSAQAAPRDRIHSLLGDTLYNLGRHSQAESHYLLALKDFPNNLYPLTRILGIRQEGKGRLPWEELCLFAPRPLMHGLREELARMGENSLIMVLALLSVVEAAGSGEAENTARACLEYRQEVENHIPGTELIKSYLLICSEEMLLHGEAACRNLSCQLYSPFKEVISLATEALELTVKELCPPWSPLAAKGMERTDPDEKNTDCKPGKTKN
ncbi:MAG: glycosyltransferase [Bacillota bacterium]